MYRGLADGKSRLTSPLDERALMLLSGTRQQPLQNDAPSSERARRFRTTTKYFIYSVVHHRIFFPLQLQKLKVFPLPAPAFRKPLCRLCTCVRVSQYCNTNIQ